MEQDLIYRGILLRRLFSRFQDIVYRGVPLCKLLYFQILGFIGNRWKNQWKNLLPHVQEEVEYFNESEIYQWSDEPYLYDAHPGGVVLMRTGFVDIAHKYLPKDRYFLISHNQAEVDLLKKTMPAEVAHSIDEFFEDNPAAVKEVMQQITKVINRQKEEPIFGSHDLWQWFSINLPKAIKIIDAVHTLFEMMNVGAVLTISSINWMESALNLVARSRRVPSITGQHGLIVDKGLYAHVPILATKKFVWGNAVSEWYQKYGYPKSRIAVTGSPRFDPICNQKWCGKQKLCERLQINPSQKIILFTTQRLHLTKERLPIILEGMKNIPNLFLILLLHPSETAVFDQYEQLIQGHLNCKVIRFGHLSLYDALSGTDYFVTCHSTSALEAMFFKIPVITIELGEMAYSFSEVGASIKVTNAAEFSQVISRLNSNESYRIKTINQYQKYLSDNCIPDGFASKRLFEEIENMCQKGGIA